MKTPTIPEPDVALKDIVPATRLIHEAVEVGISAVREFFGQMDRPIEPYLAADLVRYHAKTHIDKRISRVKGLEREPLPNNGLYVRFGNYEIRIRKSGENGVPDPGSSQTMQAFYQQKLAGWAELVGEVESAPINLLVVWDATRNYVLAGMSLVCPKFGSEDRGSTEKHWEIAIPHPASAPRPAQPRPQEVSESSSVGDEDDLPLTPRRSAETGTDNPDG